MRNPSKIVVSVGIILLPHCSSENHLRSSLKNTSQSPCPFPDFYVSPYGTDSLLYGSSSLNPYRTIQYAVDNRNPCQTIYVMEGTYRNDGFGQSDNIGTPVVQLRGVSNVTITNYEKEKVLIEFDGSGGFVGGSKTSPVAYFSLSGVEIVGPSASISYSTAMSHRLDYKSKYKGRGVAIWAGHHIEVFNNIVHHCPGSGIRVNNGDYVNITSNTVHSNTWWSSSGESAIVLATSQSIDHEERVKMVIEGNIVYDNINKIPYYNKNYDWDYSPIGGLDCGSYKNCEAGMIQGCPWQCRYGKKTQDYIIDGSGVYVTRNDQSYRYGKMELKDNISYGNGINGVVVHKTDRGIVRGNKVFRNGVVPRLDHPEPIVEDWHEGCSGKSRQPYSGIVLNNADDVELWENNVTARYDDDFAYKILDSSGAPEPLLAGGNNKVCRGLVDSRLELVVDWEEDEQHCDYEDDTLFLLDLTQIPSAISSAPLSSNVTNHHGIF